MAVDYRALFDYATGSDLDIGTDAGVRTDNHTVSQLRLGIDNRRWMDVYRHFTTPSWFFKDFSG
jgi:hypothetical protein